MPVAIESGTTTLLQIDNSIEEASTILGADTGYSFRRITLPMLKNAFFSGIVYSFTKAITAVSAVIFLVSPRWKLVTSNIYSLFDLAKYGQAAAFVTMMVGILLVFIGLFNTVINFLLAPFPEKIRSMWDVQKRSRRQRRQWKPESVRLRLYRNCRQ